MRAAIEPATRGRSTPRSTSRRSGRSGAPRRAVPSIHRATVGACGASRSGASGSWTCARRRHATSSVWSSPPSLARDVQPRCSPLERGTSEPMGWSCRRRLIPATGTSSSSPPGLRRCACSARRRPIQHRRAPPSHERKQRGTESDVERRTLGNGNFEVSGLGLGCMRMSFGDTAVDRDEMVTLVRAAVELGITYARSTPRSRRSPSRAIGIPKSCGSRRAADRRRQPNSSDAQVVPRRRRISSG